ncbi:MAG: SCP2 sterol-binding domain-containing protein [Thermoflexales bacterium]|nr:SCP2 sterol-binding domain-containing protein [Thermoflexales bacterium]MCS7324938.1 SCP2 sterol-binding domain-containing protein [Thermoflexales bacterium]MDW8054301.1 SCP2 sterol-binding domain-containing protein [Anaerolineae bacterium]MDW8291537.1 SCP2 sterol-binding domain-containing protein [Anaerolineae bacterium]
MSSTEQTRMTVLESLQQMMTRFNPALAKGVNAVIQLNASGEGGGNYVLSIREGEANVAEGTAEKPTVTIHVAASDWVDIVTGKLDPTRAFMSGRLKIAGDLALMMRFQRMFLG